MARYSTHDKYLNISYLMYCRSDSQKEDSEKLMKDLEFVSWLPTNFINRKHFWADFCCIKVSNYTGLSK